LAVVLSITSDVARGHVGNAAIRFALQRLGHEVWALPTVVLSNHPGHPKVAGHRTPADVLAAMVEALAANGWLKQIDAILTGYLPSAGHVEMAVQTIERVHAEVRRPTVLVDPVLGDHPKGLYLDEAAARAIRGQLLPLASLATPNRFELEWLSGRQVTDAADAAAAAERLAVPTVLATSVPGSSVGKLANVLVTPRGTAIAEVDQRAHAPHGTGDLLSGLLLGHLLNGEAVSLALKRAVAGVEAVLAASERCDELKLVASQEAWCKA
jgi:pyridoxine kinase